jgi:PAS domain S-box-containing protein
MEHRRSAAGKRGRATMTDSRGLAERGLKGSGVLRVLSLEDSPSDMELMQAKLAEGGIDCEMVRTQTPAQFLSALEDGGFDLILTGYAVPSFDGLSALELAREVRPEVPFILVSRPLGEELVVETMKRGATDYVVKNRLERLVPAVRRALREAEERRGQERAEEALRRNMLHLRTLVEQIPAVTYTQQVTEPASARTTRTLYAGPQIEAQWGYPPQAFVEDPELWIKLLHPEDRERVLAEDRRMNETGEPFSMEYRQIARDGRVMWIRDEAELVLDEHSRPRFWQGVMYDITDRKRAEETLQQNEQHFRAIFEQAIVGMVQIGLDGEWLRFNDRFCEILGYTRQELLRTDSRDILLPEDLKWDLERGAGILNGEYRGYSGEKCVRRGDGSVAWINLTVTLIYSSGEPQYFVAVVEDITERREAEEALSRSEILYRSVVEQAAENIFLVDIETKRVLESNDALARSLGYAPEELKRMTLYEIVAHDRKSIDRNVKLVVEAGHYFIGERQYLRRDGSFVDVEVNVSVVLYEGRDALCIVAHDVTERKRAEENLRRSLSALLALREAGQVLGSTLSSEEIVSRLLEIMRGVSRLVAAVISVQDEDGELRIWRSAGLEGLRHRARFEQEAEAARRATLEDEEQQYFRLFSLGAEEDHLVGLCLPLRAKDRVVGVLEAYGRELLADNDTLEILSSLASQAARALENAHLYEQLEERERILQDLVGKLLRAQEEERRRVAYEVHDGLAQVAVSAHQRLQAFARRHSPGTERGRRDLERILRLVRSTVSDARRIIANLRPTALDDLGLAAALAQEVESLREDGYQVDYEENLGDERLPDTVEITLFRIAQEALTNVRKHAQTRRVRIRLRCSRDEVHLEIQDYGRGFDPVLVSGESGPGERVGLAGMRERVGALGGELKIHSRPDAGTFIAVIVPLTRPAQRPVYETLDPR